MSSKKKKDESVCLECGNPVGAGECWCDKCYKEFMDRYIEEEEDIDENPEEKL